MLYVDGKPHHTLSPDELLDLIRAGSIDPPILTARQIRDKSKGDAISKGLVILQVTWFVLQLLSRAIYHLETTQLEAGTFAFTVFNFIIYAAWWNKPLDVRCPHQVYWTLTDSKPKDHKPDEHVCALISYPLADYVFSSSRSLFRRIPVLRTYEELTGDVKSFTIEKLRVPTCDGTISVHGVYRWGPMCAGYLMSTIFGGIHCIAWFSVFPTFQEQMLWRLSAAITICAPLLMFPLDVFENIDITGRIIFTLIYITCIASYIIGRAILLVLMVTTLRSLPPTAYQAVSWSSLVPHL